MSTDSPIVSDPSTRVEAQDDELEQLMKQGGKPTLAALFQQGKDKGLIKPAVEYAS